jgi:benzoylformate decarboxylase
MPRMTAKRAMLEQLMADGVRHVFGNPGTTEQGFMAPALREAIAHDGPSLVDVALESPLPLP